MARPKTPDEKQYTRHLSIRLDAAQYATICAAAEAMAMAVAAYVRWAAFAHSKKVKK
jgi:uncharacterized protein (DUF1778 family)